MSITFTPINIRNASSASGSHVDKKSAADATPEPLFKNQYNRRSLMQFDAVSPKTPYNASSGAKRSFSSMVAPESSSAVVHVEQPRMQTRSQSRVAASPPLVELYTPLPQKNSAVPRPCKSLQMAHGKNLRIGTADTIGARQTMEDEFIVSETNFSDGSKASLWAVLDGHGGAEASAFVAAHWPKMLFNMLNLLPNRTRCTEQTKQKVMHLIQLSIDRCHDALHRDLMRRGSSLSIGTTLCALLYFWPHTGAPAAQLYTINVGDSRALALKQDLQLHSTLTEDHKPSRPDEYDRIWRLGGFVTNGDGVPRVQGNLAVSRSLGDFHLHPYVSHEACIEGPTLLNTKEIGGFLICCDGVTDVLSDEKIGEEIASVAAQNGIAAASKNKDGFEKFAAEHVRNTAYEEGSGDNISVLFVKIDC